MKVYLIWKKDFCGDLNDVVLKIFRSAGEANAFLEDLAIKEGLTHDDFGGYYEGTDGCEYFVEEAEAE